MSANKYISGKKQRDRKDRFLTPPPHTPINNRNKAFFYLRRLKGRNIHSLGPLICLDRAPHLLSDLPHTAKLILGDVLFLKQSS